MYKDPFTKLTLENEDKKFTWEYPYLGVSVYDIMTALNGILVGMSFHQDTVYKEIASWLSEVASDRYEILVKENKEEELD